MLVLRAENRILYYSFISFARFFLFISLNLLLVWYFKRGVNGVFEANILVVLVVFFLLFPVYKRYFTGELSFPILKRMLIFGIPTIFTIISMRVIDYSDRRIILHYLGDAPLGQYTIAYNLGMVGIMVFVNSFRTAWQPFFLAMKTNPDAKAIYSKVATYYALFISLIFMGMVLFKNEIFLLYAPTKPVILSNIIPYIAFSYILYGFYIIMLTGIFIREKTKFLPLAAFTGALVNIVLNFVFIPKFGIIGAAYSTIFAYAVMDIVVYCISKYIYNVQYEIKRIVFVFLIIGIPIGLSYFFRPQDSVLKILYNCLLCFIPLFIYFYSSFFSPEERHYILLKFEHYCLHK
jgi:O-antigen/teichoic acid export membrane protein